MEFNGHTAIPANKNTKPPGGDIARFASTSNPKKDQGPGPLAYIPTRATAGAEGHARNTLGVTVCVTPKTVSSLERPITRILRRANGHNHIPQPSTRPLTDDFYYP